MTNSQNENYHVSQAGINLIKFSEAGDGIEKYLKTYTCPAGKKTIGFGFAETYGTYPADFSNKALAGKPVQDGQQITEKEAEELLSYQLRDFEKQVKEKVNVPLTQGQFDAITSMAFNGGIGMAQKVIDLVNDGRMQEAADKMLEYNKGDGKVLEGLNIRRKAERELFLEGEYKGVKAESDSPATHTPSSNQSLQTMTASNDRSAITTQSMTPPNNIMDMIGMAVMTLVANFVQQDSAPTLSNGSTATETPQNAPRSNAVQKM
jgi:lysozyme